MATQVSGIIEQIQPSGSSGTKYAIASTAYGYCQTAANQKAKTVDMTGFELIKGVTIHVKFQYNNTAASPTLNVNGTGALNIVQYGTTATGTTDETTSWYAGAVVSFTYDGTSWVRDQGFNTNTTYTFENGTNGFKVTPLGGTAQTVTVTPSITNNITGTGTENYLTKFTGANTIGNSGLTTDSNNNLTIPGTIYFSSNTSTSTGKALFAYNSTYPKFGIWYKEGDPDVMAFSASGNADTTTSADFAVEGGGKLYNKGNIIPNTGNSTGNVGSTTQTVYIDGGVIKAGTTLGTAATHAHGDYALAGHDHNSTYLKLDGSNNMSNDIGILFGETDKFLHFKHSTSNLINNSWRTGVLGSGTGDTNYYVIQSGGVNNSTNGVWVTALRIGQQTYDAGFAGNVYPISTTSSKTLGTSNNKWSAVYATNLYGTLSPTNLDGVVTTTAKKFLKDTGDWAQVDWGDLTNVPSSFTPSAHEHNYIGKDGFIAYPSDGRYTTSTSTVIGYIKIKIPQTKSMTMFTFDVDIYNYLSSTSTRYHIGGYNYNDASWNNCVAYCIAPLSNAKANLTVRFLSNGNDEMYIAIGETNTSWSYPQITIHNIAISFSSQATLAKWKSGWTITIDSTAFDDSLVKKTITNTNIAYTTQINTAAPTASGKIGYFAITPATSGSNTLLAQESLYIYNTIANNAITNTYLCIGKQSSIKGGITLQAGNSYYGDLITASLTANRTYTLPDATGTIALSATTLNGYGITNAVQYNGIDNDIGSSATATNAKAYWANNNKVPKGKVVFNYNSSGTEYTTLFSNNNNSYGSILRWGYSDNYIRILRAHPNQTTYNGWYTEDWEKISAGYADSAGKATNDVDGNAIKTTYAKLGGAAFTGTVTVQTPTADMNPATKKYVDNILSANNAMTFKGTLGTGGTVTTLPDSHTVGDTYRVITAGEWAGKTCVVGDLVICINTGTTAADADWTSVETNEDGAVIGTTPTSSTDNAIVRWDGTSGRIIQNSGITIDDDGRIFWTHTSGKSTSGMHFKYSNTIDYWWGVGSGDSNHGLYDQKKGSSGTWIIYAGTNNNWSFTGNAATATTAGNVTGVVALANGGTGTNAHTTNRLVWSYDSTKIQAGYHYANTTKVAINSTTEPSYNLYVNGTIGLNNVLTLTGDTAATARLAFSRTGSWNYITLPSNSWLAIGSDASSASTWYRLSSTALSPERNNEKDLGTTDWRWKNLYTAGNISIGATGNKIIEYKGTNATTAMITFLDNTTDANGNGIKIGGGGITIIGSGEAANNLTVSNAGSEVLYLLSDNQIYLEGNGQTIGNRLGLQIDNNGALLPTKAEAVNNNAQNIGAENNKWANIYVNTLVGNLYNGGACPNGKTTNPYHCIGTFEQSITSIQVNTKIIFLVSNFYSTESQGLLDVNVRWEANGAAPAFANCHWIVASGGINKDNFILTYKYDSSTKIVTLNIYAKITSAWYSYNFTKLSEHNWGTAKNEWQLHWAYNAGNYTYATIPSDETQVVSTFEEIKNESAVKTHTHPITDITWAGNTNFTTSATANNQEWSIDLTPGSYTGTYWHVWSSKNSKTILACYTDTNNVSVPNGNFSVGGSTSLSGQTTINYTTAASSTVKSGQLIVQSGTGSNAVGIELYRNTSASWQIVNTSGMLQFNDNYTTSAQNTYTNNCFSMTYNTGNATFKGSVTASSFIGNASSATGVIDAGNSSRVLTIRYGGNGAAATDWIPMHDSSGNLVPVSSTNLANKVREKASGDWGISITGNAATATSLTNFVVSTYTIASQKGVRIQFPTHVPVLISAQRSNANARLILLGGGYGEQQTAIRNNFIEVVSCDTQYFTWSIPLSSSFPNSIEIMNRQTGTAGITVWSAAACTFTEISALTSDATNHTLLHSENYSDYALSLNGGGQITGRITKEGASTNWNKGRDGALIAITKLNSYSALASMKTVNGSWDIGSYSDTSYTDDLLFTYISDTHYNGSNAVDAQIKFLENGHIVAALDGTASNANLLNSSATANTTGLQYYQGQPTIGSADGNAYEGSSSNSKLWSYPADYTAHTTVANIQTIRMYWSGSYWHDIFASPNNEQLLHRSVLNGSAKGWRLILDSANYSSYALPLGGGTMTGTIILAATGLQTNNGAGYTTDQYGNFKHARATASDTWQLINNAGTGKFTYTWESGNISTAGSISATGGFAGNLSGNATSASQVLRWSANETAIGADATPANATNESIWFNYRSGYGGTTSDAATQLKNYYFGDRKGNYNTTTVYAGTFNGNATSASKISAALNQTTKTYLLGTTTTITATAANVSLTGDTGVYLTATPGELSAYRYSWHYSTTEKAYSLWNDTDQSIDFVFI